MSSYKSSKQLLGGTILIYVLADSKNGIYQARFRNPFGNSPRYIRRSTGERTEEQATAEAMRLYNEAQQRSMMGLTSGAVTLTTLIPEVINVFNPYTQKTINSLARRYWIPFFGNKDVTSLTTANLAAYQNWRIETRTALQGSGWNASQGRISKRTLELDISLLRSVLRKGKDISRVVDVPNKPSSSRHPSVYDLPSNRSRGRFSDAQYARITAYCNSARAKLNNPRLFPTLQDPSLPPHPETNPYVFQLHRKSNVELVSISEDGDRTWHDAPYLQREARYINAVRYFAMLIVGRSGIRPQEIIKLRHKDIRLLVDEEGEYFTTLHINKDNAKVGDGRDAICSDGALSYERYLTYRREIEFRFNRSVQEEDFLFPSYANYDIRATKTLAVAIRTLFINPALDCHSTAHPEEPDVRIFFSLYSFRSYFITQRLRNGVDIYALSKCVGSSVQTIIENYDVNETWEVRYKIIQHIKATTTQRELPAHLTELATPARARAYSQYSDS
jgi:hypothetical protein